MSSSNLAQAKKNLILEMKKSKSCNRIQRKVLKQWVAALRSGEYKQGRGKLCSADERYCCLGVLADIAVDGDWIFSEIEWLLAVHVGGCSDSEKSSAYLEEEGYRLGLSHGLQTKLASYNDLGGTFAEIADLIEKYL